MKVHFHATLRQITGRKTVELDLPEGTVKSRIRRGLSRLQELLGEEALALV